MVVLKGGNTNPLKKEDDELKTEMGKVTDGDVKEFEDKDFTMAWIIHDDHLASPLQTKKDYIKQAIVVKRKNAEKKRLKEKLSSVKVNPLKKSTDSLFKTIKNGYDKGKRNFQSFRSSAERLTYRSDFTNRLFGKVKNANRSLREGIGMDSKTGKNSRGLSSSSLGTIQIGNMDSSIQGIIIEIRKIYDLILIKDKDRSSSTDYYRIKRSFNTNELKKINKYFGKINNIKILIQNNYKTILVNKNRINANYQTIFEQFFSANILFQELTYIFYAINKENDINAIKLLCTVLDSNFLDLYSLRNKIISGQDIYFLYLVNLASIVYFLQRTSDVYGKSLFISEFNISNITNIFIINDTVIKKIESLCKSKLSKNKKYPIDIRKTNENEKKMYVEYIESIYIFYDTNLNSTLEDTFQINDLFRDFKKKTLSKLKEMQTSINDGKEYKNNKYSKLSYEKFREKILNEFDKDDIFKQKYNGVELCANNSNITHIAPFMIIERNNIYKEIYNSSLSSNQRTTIKQCYNKLKTAKTSEQRFNIYKETLKIRKKKLVFKSETYTEKVSENFLNYAKYSVVFEEIFKDNASQKYKDKLKIINNYIIKGGGKPKSTDLYNIQIYEKNILDALQSKKQNDLLMEDNSEEASKIIKEIKKEYDKKNKKIQKDFRKIIDEHNKKSKTKERLKILAIVLLILAIIFILGGIALIVLGVIGIIGLGAGVYGGLGAIVAGLIALIYNEIRKKKLTPIKRKALEIEENNDKIQAYIDTNINILNHFAQLDGLCQAVYMVYILNKNNFKNELKKITLPENKYYYKIKNYKLIKININKEVLGYRFLLHSIEHLKKTIGFILNDGEYLNNFKKNSKNLLYLKISGLLQEYISIYQDFCDEYSSYKWWDKLKDFFDSIMKNSYHDRYSVFNKEKIKTQDKFKQDNEYEIIIFAINKFKELLICGSNLIISIDECILSYNTFDTSELFYDNKEDIDKYWKNKNEICKKKIIKNEYVKNNNLLCAFSLFFYKNHLFKFGMKDIQNFDDVIKNGTLKFDDKYTLNKVEKSIKSKKENFKLEFDNNTNNEKELYKYIENEGSKISTFEDDFVYIFFKYGELNDDIRQVIIDNNNNLKEINKLKEELDSLEENEDGLIDYNETNKSQENGSSGNGSSGNESSGKGSAGNESSGNG